METPPDTGVVASGTTFHLAVAAEWAAARGARAYAPAAFTDEGFVHCTDGLGNLVDTANRYYRTAPGPFLALEVDLARVGAEVRYDAEPRIFPHVYGPIEVSAVVRVLVPEREPDGTFVGFQPG